MKKFISSQSSAFALLFYTLLLPGIVAAESSPTSPQDIIEELQATPISRFEWGLLQYRLALIEHFRHDPSSLALSQPPFFINVTFEQDKTEILVEIGRTFGTSEETRARQFCEDYLVHARSMLAIDKVGRPVVQGISSLAKDFFSPVDAAPEVIARIGRALDAAVVLRGLVVAPASGIYSVCGARLIDMPVKHLE